MNKDVTRVLLIEYEPEDARLFQEALQGARNSPFHTVWVRSIALATQRLKSEVFDVILLDLTLPDGLGIEAFYKIFQAAPNTLIIILSSSEDDVVAGQAVERGAYGYLIKGRTEAHWAPQALHNIIERKTVQEALLRSEARFRAISDASPPGIFVSDVEGECVCTNAAYQKISGLIFEQTLGTHWSMAIHPDDTQSVLSDWQRAVKMNCPFQTEMHFLRADHKVAWRRLNAVPMADGLNSCVQTVEDISQRKRTELILQGAEEALFAEKELAQVTLNLIGDAVLTTDILGRVTYLNQVAELMTGWLLTEANGQPLASVFLVLDAESREPIRNPAQLAIDEDRVVELACDCVLIHRDGSEAAIEVSAAPIHNRDGSVAGAVIVFRDVTHSRAIAQRMSHLAHHDFLTGLPNRSLLTERFSQAIGQAKRRQKQVALLFLDLDDFKNVNDSLGHLIGDALLKSVAARLVSCVRVTDTVSRQGGDEFVILLSEIENPIDAANVADKLLAAFALPHVVGSHELHVTLSIGASIYPDDGILPDAVMQNADTAMYHAKANGRNNCLFFKPEMNTHALHRLVVEGSLRRALKQGEFILHYQPQIALDSGAMIGAEALIRWRDPNHGLLYPNQFIPIAEECGLIVPIGRWVLREACRQVKAWLDLGLAAVPVAVNISAVEFRHKDFLAGVALILAETGLAPEYLELELTESMLMHDADASTEVLKSLKALGVGLAIDDFGTGYSSLSYLKRFPINVLKIDQSFVHDISGDTNDAAIVTAVIGMGRTLRQRVVAEGVETQEQLDFLRAHHCDEGQGFQFSHPLSAGDFAAWLANEFDVRQSINGQGQLWSRA